MKTKTILMAISLFASVIVFNACSETESDTTKPVITLNAPEEGDVLKIGSDIHFDMELEDNEMLLSYKIEIHSNFDGHEHTKAEADETEAFRFNRSWDVSGLKNKHEHHHLIIIPENATPGAYHFIVYCTDLAGNESYVARNITLSHDGKTGEHVH